MRFHAENKIEIRALDEYLVEELTSTLGLSAPGAAAAQLRSCGHVCGRSTIGPLCHECFASFPPPPSTASRLFGL
jgi:hypothetical protein